MEETLELTNETTETTEAAAPEAEAALDVIPVSKTEAAEETPAQELHYYERERLEREKEKAERAARREELQKARQETREKAGALKKALIDEAEALLNIENFKEAGEKFNTLMDRWKAAGSAGHEEDENLWSLFNEKRSQFRELRNKFYDEQKLLREQSLEKKLALIEAAKAIDPETVEDWKAASDTMNALMDEWKAAGYAGKEHNDKLWQDFSDARQPFFDKRHAVYEERDSYRIKIAEAKEELIKKAQTISDSKEYTKENADAMKQLDIDWKNTGNAGRTREDELWERFKAAKEGFWEGRHKIAEEKQAEWHEKAKGIIKSKKKQIDDLHKQVLDLSASIKNSTDWNRISQVREWIEQKEQIIDKLKKEIKSME